MLRELVSSSPEEREAQICAKHITRGLDRDAVVRLREALAGMTVDGVEEAVARSKHIDDIGGIVHFDEAQDRSNYINGVGGMEQVQGAISLRRSVESHYPKAEFGSLARMIEGLVEMCRAEGDNAVLQFPKLLEHGSKCLKISRTDPLRIMVGIQEALSLVAQAGGNKQLKLQVWGNCSSLSTRLTLRSLNIPKHSLPLDLEMGRPLGRTVARPVHCRLH